MITKADLITEIVDNIGPKFWDDGEYSAITKSRTGIFGVVTETMATIFENAVIYNAIKDREMLTTTASRYTLLKEAAMYSDLTISDAKPAEISIFLGVPVPYLQSKWMLNSSSIEFILDADTLIKISEIPFLLDYDLKIVGKLVDGKWLYSAQYILDDENRISNVSSPYLVSTMKSYENVQYIMVNVLLRQLTKSYNYYTILETEAISLNGLDFTYDDHLAYFNVLYKTADSSEYELLDKINYLSNAIGDGKYVYFDTSTVGKIRIYIPTELNFEFNSELRVDIYTTTGTGGSFTYNAGAITVSPSSFNNEIDYTGSYFKPVVISEASTGGTDIVSTDSLRSQIINYKSTLRSIDTESDLTKTFNDLDPTNKTLFIRKRVDVYEKIYTSLMLLKDSTGNIMSTNTLDIHLSESDVAAHYVQTGRRIIKPTKAYTLIQDGGYKLQSIDVSGMTDAAIAVIENDTSKFLYGCPYLIMINENPQSVSYYLNSIDFSNSMMGEYYNESGLIQFIINTISIKRDAISGSDKYRISFNLIPSSTLPDGIVDTTTGAILDPTMIKVYGYIYSALISDSIISYFNITINSYNVAGSYFEASAELTTDEYLSLSDELRFVGCLYDPGTDVPTDTVIPISDIKLGIGVYYKSTTVTNKDAYASIVPNMDEYGLMNVYTNKNDLAYTMINMSKQIRSNLTFVDEGAGVISFNIKQVPLLRYRSLRSNISRVSTIIKNANLIITSMLTLVKNNTSIDYKFYATYGKSRYFTIGNTATLLDNLTLSLTFKVLIPTTSVDTTLDAELKSFIQPFVEKVNEIKTTTSIYFSNIITQVENEYKYKQNRIVSCELVKINNYDVVFQSLVNNTKIPELMTKTELLEFIPEFTRIPRANITINLVRI